MNIKQLLEQHGITPFRAGTSHGGEWHSSCPGCGDGSPRKSDAGPSDRFQIWPEKTEGVVYYCRKCGAHGDTIQFLIDFDHKTFPEACALLGIDKGGKKATPYRTPSTPKPPTAPAPPTFNPATPDLPAAAWMAKATEFAEWSFQQMLACPEAAAMLEWRGLTLETAIRYRIGYNPGENGKDLYRSRKAWGLPDEKSLKTGRLKTQWLPRGLVMAVFSENGQVIHLRVRRRPEDIKPNEESYWHIKGGAHVTLVLEPSAKAFAVTESGLDAYLCAQEGRGLVGAISTWNAQSSPDAAACQVLNQAMRILVALDADPVKPNEKTGQPQSAGAQGSIKWLQRWPNTAKRWPVPVGKDPGEAIKAGCNLRAWLIAGLPPALTIGDLGNLACEVEGGAAISGRAEEKGGNDDGDQGVQQVVNQVVSGAGDEPACVQVAGEETPEALVVAPVDPVAELRELLRKTGIVVVKAENGADLTITSGRPGAPDDLKQRVSRLVFQDAAVFAYINALPDGRIAVNG